MNIKTYSLNGVSVRVDPQWTIFANMKSRESHVVRVIGLPNRRSAVRVFTITELTQ